MPEKRTRNKKLSKLTRERMVKTGESYTAARAHIIGRFKGDENMNNQETELFFRMRAWIQDHSRSEPHIATFHEEFGISQEEAEDFRIRWGELGLIEHRMFGFVLTYLGKSVPNVPGLSLGALLGQENCQRFVDGEDLVWWTGDVSIRVSKHDGYLRFLLRWDRTVGTENKNGVEAAFFIKRNIGSERRGGLETVWNCLVTDVEAAVGRQEGIDTTESLNGVKTATPEIPFLVRFEGLYDDVLAAIRKG